MAKVKFERFGVLLYQQFHLYTSYKRDFRELKIWFSFTKLKDSSGAKVSCTENSKMTKMENPSLICPLLICYCNKWPPLGRTQALNPSDALRKWLGKHTLFYPKQRQCHGITKKKQSYPGLSFVFIVFLKVLKIKMFKLKQWKSIIKWTVKLYFNNTIKMFS